MDRYKRMGTPTPRIQVEKMMNFPKYWPFYYGIIADDMQNIYVSMILEENEQKQGQYDFFSKEGYYLYRINIPVRPQKIKNELLYVIESDDKTGYIQLKRYRIKNWNQLREYRPE